MEQMPEPMEVDKNLVESDDSTDVDSDLEKERALQTLLRMTVKAFYEPKYLLIVDLIIEETHVSEERLDEYFHFDLRDLRECLSVLNSDRLIHKKTVQEFNEGTKRNRRVNYYYIKFGQLVNVIRYRLDTVRKNVRTLDKDRAAMISFKCSQCGKRFSDMQAGEIMRLSTYKFACPICAGRVVEDVSAIGNHGSMHTAKFNLQVGPIYDALKKIDSLSSN